MKENWQKSSENQEMGLILNKFNTTDIKHHNYFAMYADKISINDKLSLIKISKTTYFTRSLLGLITC